MKYKSKVKVLNKSLIMRENSNILAMGKYLVYHLSMQMYIYSNKIIKQTNSRSSNSKP